METTNHELFHAPSPCCPALEHDSTTLKGPKVVPNHIFPVNLFQTPTTPTTTASLPSLSTNSHPHIPFTDQQKTNTTPGLVQSWPENTPTLMTNNTQSNSSFPQNTTTPICINSNTINNIAIPILNNTVAKNTPHDRNNPSPLTNTMNQSYKEGDSTIDNVTKSKLFTVLNFPIMILISVLSTFYSSLVKSWEYVKSIISPQSKKKKQRKSKDNENSTQNISTSSSSPLPPLGFLSVLSGRTSRSNSNSERLQSKKYLILDLDETLIHASTTPPRADHERLYNYVLDVQIDHVNCTFYVSERPHLKLFMEKVCEWFNVVIFTASVKNYANPVIDRLYRSEKIVQRLFRSSCYVTEHGVYVKDLKTVTDDLTKCMIIDNSPISYMWYQENAIPISNWMGDNERDRALINLLPFLEAMRHLDDVKSILSFRVGL